MPIRLGEAWGIAPVDLERRAGTDDDPCTTGGIGLLGTLASQEAMERCDALLIVGSTFPYVEYYPKPGQARGVQIDRDGQRIGLRFPVDAGLVGDATETLHLLNSRLTRKPGRSFLQQAQDGMRRWREMMQQAVSHDGRPLKPQRVARAFGRRLNQIAWEQMMFLGNPQFACELQPIDFAKAAEAMGGLGFSIDNPDDIERVLDEAFAQPGPVLIEATVDTYEPMMPRRMPAQYAMNFRKALPETPHHERIEQSIAEEPARSMMTAEEPG